MRLGIHTWGLLYVQRRVCKWGGVHMCGQGVCVGLHKGRRQVRDDLADCVY